MKKIILIVTLFLMLGGGYYLINNYQLISKGEKAETMVYQGQVEYLEGELERRMDVNSWKAIGKGTIVKQGEELRTLASSRAIITFEDGSLMRLAENTTVQIQNTENDIDILLTKGTIYNKVSKNENRRYMVESEDFKMVALGTEFSVDNENGEVEVIVIESAVEVQDAKTGEKLEKIETNEKAQVTKKEVKKKRATNKDKKKFADWKNADKSVEDNGKAKNANGVKEEKNKNEQPPYGLDPEREKEIKDSYEKKAKETKKVVKKTVAPISKISIWGKSTSNGVEINWSVIGVDVSKGFKLVRSTNKNPVYPGDDYKYFSDSKKRSYNWKIEDGKGYYFRVCQYLGGKCGVYSKNLYLTAPQKMVEKATNDEDENEDNIDNNEAQEVQLSVTHDDTHVILTWGDLDGTAPHGFKAIYSESANPVYPGNTYHYLSSPDVRTTKWSLSDFPAGKTYHFRVCIYKGNGVCGAYSNDVAHEL